MNRSLVVGSANIDLVMATARLPVPGETLLGTCGQTLGGKGANQAVAAARACACRCRCVCDCRHLHRGQSAGRAIGHGRS